MSSEAIAIVTENVAYSEQRWPPPRPHQFWVESTRELGRVHVIAMRESLAESERVLAEQNLDASFQVLVQRLTALILPGSMRRTYLRVV